MYPSVRVFISVLEHSLSELILNATSYAYIILLLLLIASQDSSTEVVKTSAKRSVSLLSTVKQLITYNYACNS